MAAILGVFAGICAYAIAQGSPLIYDEAVYSLRAQDFLLGDAPGRYWMEVRAPGLPLLLTPLSFLNGSDQWLRAGSLFIAVVGVALTWYEGRLLFGRAAAPVAAALVALSPGWILSGWQVLPDIPGATLTLACVVLLTSATQTDRVRWWALLVPPIAAFATVVRFGAPLLIGPALAMVVILRWKVIRRSMLFVSGVAVATLASVLVVWLVPAATGKADQPVLLFLGRQTAKQVGYLDRLASFGEFVPLLLGTLVGAAVLVGLAAAGLGAFKRQVDFAPIVGCVAVALTVALALAFGIADHQLRYFTPVMPFLALGAAPGLVWVRSRLPKAAVSVAAVLVVVSGVLVGFGTVNRATASSNDAAGGQRQAALQLASVASRPCIVLSRNPSNEWYSGCETILFPVDRPTGQPPAIGIEDTESMLRRLRSRMKSMTANGTDPTVYVALSEPQGTQEPRGGARRVLLNLATGTPVTIRTEHETNRVYRLGSASRVLAKVTNLLRETSE